MPNAQEHMVHIVPNNGSFELDQNAISTNANDLVKFINDTNRTVNITLSNRDVLDSPNFHLDSQGKRILEVKKGPSDVKVDCVVVGETSGGTATKTVKPTIIVNRK